MFKENGFVFEKLHELEPTYIDQAAEVLSDEWSTRSAQDWILILINMFYEYIYYVYENMVY